MRSILQHHSGIISSNLCICSFLSTIHLHKLSKQIWGYLPNCTQCQRVGTSGGSPGPLHWFHRLVQRAPSVHMCLLNEWLSGSVDGNQGGIKIRWHCKVLSCSVVSDSLRPQEPQAARLLSPWDFSGKNSGGGYHFLLHRVFLTQGSNPQLRVSCIGRSILDHRKHEIRKEFSVQKYIPECSTQLLEQGRKFCSYISQRQSKGGCSLHYKIHNVHKTVFLAVHWKQN